MVRHCRDIGPRHQLAVHEVDQHGSIHSTELPWNGQAVQVELLDPLEDLGEPTRKDHLAVDELDALCVDFLFVGLDFLGHELSEHLDDVSVERDRFVDVAEAFAIRVSEVMLRDAYERLPVDAFVEVVLNVVVVFEEVGHGHSLRASSV